MDIHIYLYILCSICRITVGVETTNSLSHWKSKRKMYGCNQCNCFVVVLSEWKGFYCFLSSLFLYLIFSFEAMPILFTLRLQQHYWLHSKVLRLIIICTIVVLCIIKEDKQQGKHRKFDMAIAWYDGNLNISGCIKIWSWFLFYLYRDFTNI